MSLGPFAASLNAYSNQVTSQNVTSQLFATKAAGLVQSPSPAQVDSTLQAAITRQEQAAQTAAVQDRQAGTSVQQSSAAVQVAASTPDRTPELLRQLAEQLSVSATQDAEPDSGEGQSQLIAAQAAELASARQAMQLMSQLLETTERASQQPRDSRADLAAISASNVQALLSQLLQAQPAAMPSLVAPPQTVAPDQSQVLAAQAAELASARQAMQLLAQLLEQEAASTAGSTSAVQPIDGPASSEDALLREAAIELRLQQALEMMLQAQAGRGVQTQV